MDGSEEAFAKNSVPNIQPFASWSRLQVVWKLETWDDQLRRIATILPHAFQWLSRKDSGKDSYEILEVEEWRIPK